MPSRLLWGHVLGGWLIGLAFDPMAPVKDGGVGGLGAPGFHHLSRDALSCCRFLIVSFLRQENPLRGAFRCFYEVLGCWRPHKWSTAKVSLHETWNQKEEEIKRMKVTTKGSKQVYSWKAPAINLTTLSIRMINQAGPSSDVGLSGSDHQERVYGYVNIKYSCL